MNAPAIIQPSEATEDGDLHYLPLNAIDVKPGFNPRQYFDPAALDTLTASVKAQGVLQPIAVRPQPENPGNYWLIAGERRLRAAQAARLPEIPAIIRQVDEATALALALAENSDRDGISPAEEADTGRRMLDACGGDRGRPGAGGDVPRLRALRGRDEYGAGTGGASPKRSVLQPDLPR